MAEVSLVVPHHHLAKHQIVSALMYMTATAQSVVVHILPNSLFSFPQNTMNIGHALAH